MNLFSGHLIIAADFLCLVLDQSYEMLDCKLCSLLAQKGSEDIPFQKITEAVLQLTSWITSQIKKGMLEICINFVFLVF